MADVGMETGFHAGLGRNAEWNNLIMKPSSQDLGLHTLGIVARQARGLGSSLWPMAFHWRFAMIVVYDFENEK